LRDFCDCLFNAEKNAEECTQSSAEKKRAAR
jgi:hypothetical protein